MMSTETDVDLSVLEAHEFDIMCDYQGLPGDNVPGTTRGPHDDPAAWIVHKRNHGCGSKGPNFACEGCKLILIDTPGFVRCIRCDECFSPGEFYVSVERLKAS